MRFHREVAIAVILSAWTQGGCSFLLVEGPPRRGEIPYRRADDSFCTENNRAPAADLVLAGVTPVASLFLASGLDLLGNETAVKAMLASALVLSGVEVVSAIWGFRTTARCRQYGAWVLRDEDPAVN